MEKVEKKDDGDGLPPGGPNKFMAEWWDENASLTRKTLTVNPLSWKKDWDKVTYSEDTMLRFLYAIVALLIILIIFVIYHFATLNSTEPDSYQSYQGEPGIALVLQDDTPFSSAEEPLATKSNQEQSPVSVQQIDSDTGGGIPDESNVMSESNSPESANDPLPFTDGGRLCWITHYGPPRFPLGNPVCRGGTVLHWLRVAYDMGLHGICAAHPSLIQWYSDAKHTDPPIILKVDGFGYYLLVDRKGHNSVVGIDIYEPDQAGRNIYSEPNTMVMQVEWPLTNASEDTNEQTTDDSDPEFHSW